MHKVDLPAVGLTILVFCLEAPYTAGPNVAAGETPAAEEAEGEATAVGAAGGDVPERPDEAAPVPEPSCSSRPWRRGCQSVPQSAPPP